MAERGVCDGDDPIPFFEPIRNWKTEIQSLRAIGAEQDSDESGRGNIKSFAQLSGLLFADGAMKAFCARGN
jgi:hypothetical protein